MSAALAWGALSASSLLIGALLALARDWSKKVVGLVLGFGAGALISAVSFELAEEGAALGGRRLAGARPRRRARSPTTCSTARWRRWARGGALALGAFLDGIPEQAVLGIGSPPARV